MVVAEVIFAACPVATGDVSDDKFRGTNGGIDGASDVDSVDGCVFKQVVDGKIRGGDETECWGVVDCSTWLVSDSALADGVKGAAMDGVDGRLEGREYSGREVSTEAVV